MAKDSLELILDGGGVMDQMIPLDGSWEGNSREVLEKYYPKEVLDASDKQLEITMYQQQGQADGHIYQKAQQDIERQKRLSNVDDGYLDKQKLESALEKQETQNEQAKVEAAEHVAELEDNRPDYDYDADGE